MDERKTGSFHLTGAGQSGGVSAQPSDRELLERAANAAGYHWRWFGETFCTLRNEVTGRHGPWNPLDDDGDALRLAVKLRIDVDQGEIGTEDGTPAAIAGYRIELRENFYRWESVAEVSEPDPHAATRRAIVRAAAALAERSAEPTHAGTERHTRNEPDPESGISPGSSIPVERGMV